MIAKKLLTTIAFAFVLLFSGCAEDDFVGVDGLCPLVVSTVPEDGATDVPLNQIITATFNEKMNPATITGSSFTVSINGVLIAGTVTYNGLTATFTPSSLLEPDTEYTGTITTMAKDERGNALQENYVWTFTTLPEYLVVVSSNPLIGGITTGGGVFLKGTAVTVNAVPNAGYTFTNWTSGGVQVSTSPNYTFVLMGDRTLVANYTLIPPTQFAVTTVASPPAGGSTTGGGAYDQGTIVPVTATANTGYNFVNWTVGGVQVSVNPNYSFVLTANTNLVANFVLKTYTLTVLAVNGAVVKSPNQTTYTHGTSVVLTATPADGYQFSSWSGDATGTNNPLTVVMNSNKIITANFTIKTYTLTVNAVNGSVLKVPNQTTYNHGAAVVLTPTPDDGYVFSSWSGDATGNAVPLTVIMNSNKNITANFTAIPSGSLFSSRFGLFGGTAGMTNMGTLTQIVGGDIGTIATGTSAITGFHDSNGDIYTETGDNIGSVSGRILTCTNSTTGPTSAGVNAANCADANAGLLAIQAAYNALAGMPVSGVLLPANLSGLTVAPGVYKAPAGSFMIQDGLPGPAGDLTLNGSATDVWVFQMSTSLTVGGPGAAFPRSVKLTGGALAKNVYWQVGSTAIINAGGGGTMVGTIIAQQGVKISTAGNVNIVTLNGRALSLVASVTLVNTIINVPN